MTIFMYAAAADMHCGDLKIRGNEMNTLISYVYRDDGNWKTYNDCVVKGEITKEQEEQIISCLENGQILTLRLRNL